uniref:Uncharacterized protein n=1 Tax=Arundo donax TaxID=35708 RepID=A0A0A9DHF3_ARUDO
MSVIQNSLLSEDNLTFKSLRCVNLDSNITNLLSCTFSNGNIGFRGKVFLFLQCFLSNHWNTRFTITQKCSKKKCS